MPGVYDCAIVKKERLAESIYSITASCSDIVGIARAGQFVSVKCGEERLLRRPISICQVSDDELSLVFEAKGDGTKWLSLREPGQKIDILGPLGNGFSMPEGNAIAVGGGIGSPPLLFAAESSKSITAAVLGFRSMDRIILKDEFEVACEKLMIATDDGSSGIEGTVAKPLEILLESGEYDAVLACGPRTMLQTVAELCRKHGVRCQVSLEERMACGVGACVVCACATMIDGIEGMSRVCKDGPVFNAEVVKWQ